MFGYVKPLKDELKVRQYDVFKSYYCGLCHHIRALYGQPPRLALNYDLTTLAVLLDGLSPDSTYFYYDHCLAKLGKKKQLIKNNQALSYSAGMNVALVYYKLLDDVQDEGTFKSKALAATLSPYKSKFPTELKPILQVIQKDLKALDELETSKTFSSLDEISHPFSDIVGHILKCYPYVYHEDSTQLRETLYKFGYALGKWIYLIDALDDLEEDMEKNKFNPIYTLYGNDLLTYEELFELIKETLSFTLLNCGFICDQILKALPLRRNRALLKNIIVLGMMDEYEKVMHSKHCRSCKTERR